jgi:hypothetical protein
MQHRALEEKKQAESLINPTPVMLEVLQRMEEREKERENMTWQQQLQHLTVSRDFFLTGLFNFFYILDQGSQTQICRSATFLRKNGPRAAVN